MYINILLFLEIMYVRGIEGGRPDTWLRLNEARGRKGENYWRLFAVEFYISAEATWCGQP